MPTLPTFPLAYLDPGAGAILLQLLVAGAAGVAVFFKYQGRRIKALLTGKGRARDQEVSQDS